MRVEGSGIGNEVLKISESGISGVGVSTVGEAMEVKSSVPIHSSPGIQ